MISNTTGQQPHSAALHSLKMTSKYHRYCLVSLRSPRQSIVKYIIHAASCIMHLILIILPHCPSGLFAYDY